MRIRSPAIKAAMGCRGYTLTDIIYVPPFRFYFKSSGLPEYHLVGPGNFNYRRKSSIVKTYQEKGYGRG